MKPLRENQDEEQLNTARSVFFAESEALAALANQLPVDFLPAIDAILKTKGKVIVSGIGKSGIVARKISASFASTGTPSHYVHPAEAGHGDLGMIAPEDLVIMLSKSGESSELRHILAHAKRFSIPVVAIAMGNENALMQAADYRLALPLIEEACGMDMAPTTSTTLMMAMGDALTISLMHRRDFQKENFGELHPSGSLGAKLSTAGQLMHKGDELPLVDVSASMQDTLLVMTSKGFGVAIVTENDQLVGVITDGDLRRHMDHLLDHKAGEIASTNPLVGSEDQIATEALAQMNERKVTVLVIVDHQQIPIGVLHLHDLLNTGVA